MTTTVEAVIAALDEVIDPCSVGAGAPLTVNEMGLIKDVRISPEGKVAILLRLSSPGCLMGGYYFEPRIKECVGRVQGVTEVTLELGDPLSWTEDEITEEGRRKLALARRERQLRAPVAAVEQRRRIQAARGV
ncbi:MAG: DUF59 domain-containing protein [Bauldia sp.]|nr:DUF59 domain-containing protein [Bauldia sp.]